MLGPLRPGLPGQDCEDRREMPEEDSGFRAKSSMNPTLATAGFIDSNWSPTGQQTKEAPPAD